LFDLPGVINMYNAGNAQPRPTPQQVNDPMFPKTDPLLKSLGLNKQDREDLQAFLETLSERRIRIRPPELPGMSVSRSTSFASWAKADG